MVPARAFGVGFAAVEGENLVRGSTAQKDIEECDLLGVDPERPAATDPRPGLDDPAARSEPRKRRITTGLVFTLQAMNSEVSASPGLKAKMVMTWMLTLSFELNTASPHKGE